MQILRLTLLRCVLFQFLLLSCASPNESTQKEEGEFIPVDVYGNPNEFEGYPELQIGQSPPDLSIDKWYNGDGITEFDQGQVYIVEFFASWCQPCRKSIPHLSKLQEKFEKEVTVIGVAASESEPNPKKLERMIAAKSLSLDYLVGYSKNEEMFKNWMWGAKNTGLPWVFVIDKEGKIAWFGQPFDTRFEDVLHAVINNTYEAEDEKNRRESSLTSRQSLWEKQEIFWTAYGEENWQTTLKLGVELYNSKEQSFYYEVATLFEIYYDKLDQKERANEWKDKLLAGYHGNVPEALGLMSEVLLADEESNKALEQGMKLAKQANELTLYENSELLVILANFHERSNDLEKAKSIYQKALLYNDDDEIASIIEEKLVEFEGQKL